MYINLPNTLNILDIYQKDGGKLMESSEESIEICIHNILNCNGFRCSSEIQLENALGGLYLFASKQPSLKAQQAIKKIETAVQGGCFDTKEGNAWKILGEKADQLGLEGQERTDYIIAGKRYYRSLVLCAEEAESFEIKNPEAFIDKGWALYMEVAPAQRCSEMLAEYLTKNCKCLMVPCRKDNWEKLRAKIAELLFDCLEVRDFSCIERVKYFCEGMTILKGLVELGGKEEDLMGDMVVWDQYYGNENLINQDVALENRLSVHQQCQELETQLCHARALEEVVRTRIPSYYCDSENLQNMISSKEWGVNGEFSSGDYDNIAKLPLTEEEKNELSREIQDIETWQKAFISLEPRAKTWSHVGQVISDLIEEGIGQGYSVTKYVALGFNWYSNLVCITIRANFYVLQTGCFLDYGMDEYKAVYEEGIATEGDPKEFVYRVLEERERLIATIEGAIHEDKRWM